MIEFSRLRRKRKGSGKLNISPNEIRGGQKGASLWHTLLFNFARRLDQTKNEWGLIRLLSLSSKAESVRTDFNDAMLAQFAVQTRVCTLPEVETEWLMRWVHLHWLLFTFQRDFVKGFQCLHSRSETQDEGQFDFGQFKLEFNCPKYKSSLKHCYTTRQKTSTFLYFIVALCAVLWRRSHHKIRSNRVVCSSTNVTTTWPVYGLKVSPEPLLLT